MIQRESEWRARPLDFAGSPLFVVSNTDLAILGSCRRSWVPYAPLPLSISLFGFGSVSSDYYKEFEVEEYIYINIYIYIYIYSFDSLILKLLYFIVSVSLLYTDQSETKIHNNE